MSSSKPSHGVSFRVKPVANPRFCLDVLRRARIRLQLLSDVGNEDTQVLRLLRAAAAPDRGEDGAMSEHFAAVREKVLNHVVLFWGQVYRLATDLHQALLWVDLEITRFIGGIGLGRRRRAAQ